MKVERLLISSYVFAHSKITFSYDMYVDFSMMVNIAELAILCFCNIGNAAKVLESEEKNKLGVKFLNSSMEKYTKLQFFRQITLRKISANYKRPMLL